MKSKSGIAILFIIVTFASCKKANRFDCFKRTGKPVVERRALDNFTVVEVTNNLQTYLIQDTVNFVEVKAGNNLISNVETSVSGQKLVVQNNNKCNFTRSYKNNIEVYVHFAKLDELIYKGTGAITSLNTIINSVFTFNSWDATDSVKLKLDVPLVYANIHTGVADLIVEGQCEELFAYARSSGAFRMQKFKCSKLYTNNLSSSDHYFWVEDKLEALVQYVGNTYYTGQPAEINATVNDKGKLIHL